jgi:hypothetical protein
MHTMTAGENPDGRMYRIHHHSQHRTPYLHRSRKRWGDKDGKFDKLRSIFPAENEEWDRTILQVFNTQIASEAIVFCYPMADAMFDMMVGKGISELIFQRNQKPHGHDCRANHMLGQPRSRGIIWWLYHHDWGDVDYWDQVERHVSQPYYSIDQGVLDILEDVIDAIRPSM